MAPTGPSYYIIITILVVVLNFMVIFKEYCNIVFAEYQKIYNIDNIQIVYPDISFNSVTFIFA